MKPVNVNLNIIKYLNAVNYDYLNKPKGDGISDDGPIIQARAYASRFNDGISTFPNLKSSSLIIKSTINLSSGVNLKGQ